MGGDSVDSITSPRGSGNCFCLTKLPISPHVAECCDGHVGASRPFGWNRLARDFVQSGMDERQQQAWYLLRAMGILEHAEMLDAGRCFPSSRLHRPADQTLPNIEHVCERNGMQSVERSPRTCPNGHPLGARRVLVGWVPCDCISGAGGHRTYECRKCGVTIVRPPHVGPPRPGVKWS